MIGSETSGGVYDVHARDCRFESTDRGLRIKTRRGRGSSAVVDGVVMENVVMRAVGTPFVVNSFYRCDPHELDPAARRHHVDDRGWRAVDDGTPTIRNLSLERIDCTLAAHSAGYVLGLPERPIENLRLRDYRVALRRSRAAGATRHGRIDRAGGASRACTCATCGVLRSNRCRSQGAQGPGVIRENVE